MLWSYGITTVQERLNTTLPTTIKSLARAGFPKPRLFIDGVDIADQWRSFNLNISSRWPRVGAMQNWIMSLTELYYREPTADRYVIFQDDIICVSNLRTYLEHCLYQPQSQSQPQPTLPDKSYLNLYTVLQNQMLVTMDYNTVGAGWFQSNQKGKGALGLVFGIDAVRTILSSEYMQKKILCPIRGHKNIDGAVINVMRMNGFIEYCHSPSLIQHIGIESSTVENKPKKPAPLFHGESFDALNYLQFSQ